MEQASHPTERESQAAAQRRADRIRAFAQELEQLERDGVLVLSEAQRASLASHHERTLRDLARAFNVDTTHEEKQLSWGMRIASFLGALALGASAYFLFHRFWGLLPTSGQVGVLIAAPLLACLMIEVVARMERTMYFAGLAALVAMSCAVLNLSVLGDIFNIVPSHKAFLAWAIFAFALAYGYGLRLLLVGGILALMGYLSAETGTWGGCYWLGFGERPENFLPAGLAIFALPAILKHRRHADFPPLYRIFGLLGILLPVLVLSNWGGVSYLLWPDARVEAIYQTVGFALAGFAIWAGIAKGWREVTNLGCTFFVIQLYTKFYDWWWDWMPKYLFFLLLGVVAVVLLLLLMKLRGRARQALA